MIIARGRKLTMVKRIKVGMASCGIAAGAGEVKDKILEMNPDAEVVEVGCIGHCHAEPLVEIETEEGPKDSCERR